jgi:hypothetical protein
VSDRLPANPYRYGLIAVAIGQLGATLQALLTPRSFYDDFPLGRGWVTEYPAYNSHLIQDYGAFTLGAVVALVLAAIWLDRRVVQLAIISWLVGSTIHLISHIATIDRFGTGDAIANLGGLTIFVVVPAWLLVKSRSPQRPQERSIDAPAESPGRA